MAREIEKKFLINELPVEVAEMMAGDVECIKMQQGYLTDIKHPEGKSSVRVRIEGDVAKLTVKSLEIGLSRDEFEYLIPLDEAESMLNRLSMGQSVLEKTRYLFETDSELKIELDVFEGVNAGLIVAEVEFPSEEDANGYSPPEWFGPEVTDYLEFFNVNLHTQEWRETAEKLN